MGRDYGRPIAGWAYERVKAAREVAIKRALREMMRAGTPGPVLIDWIEEIMETPREWDD
jgi:glyoxylate carboligase